MTNVEIETEAKLKLVILCTRKVNAQRLTQRQNKEQGKRHDVVTTLTGSATCTWCQPKWKQSHVIEMQNDNNVHGHDVDRECTTKVKQNNAHGHDVVMHNLRHQFYI